MDILSSEAADSRHIKATKDKLLSEATILLLHVKNFAGHLDRIDYNASESIAIFAAQRRIEEAVDMLREATLGTAPSATQAFFHLLSDTNERTLDEFRRSGL